MSIEDVFYDREPKIHPYVGNLDTLSEKDLAETFGNTKIAQPQRGILLE